MTSLFLTTKYKDKIPIGGKFLCDFDYEIKPEVGDSIKYNNITYTVVGVKPSYGGNELIHIDIFLKTKEKSDDMNN